MVIILTSHELIDKLIRSLYNLIDLFDLLLFDFFITTVGHFFILAILLNWSSKGIRKGVSVWLFDWRVIQR